jgi:hypothetical protein
MYDFKSRGHQDSDRVDQPQVSAWIFPGTAWYCKARDTTFSEVTIS